jgi:DNA-binding NtrC family response regulator
MLFKQAAFDKAAKVCEEVLETIGLAGDACHAQMKEAWSQLGTYARTRTITIDHIITVRHYMARHWNLPATCGPFQVEISPACLPDLAIEESRQAVPTPPEEHEASIPSSLDYKTSLEQFDARLIRAALERHAGEIRATARELGISKNTLKARMSKYGIEA